MKAAKDGKMSGFYSRDSAVECPLGKGSSNPKIGPKLSELKERTSRRKITSNRVEETDVSSKLPKNVNAADFELNKGTTEEITLNRKGVKKTLKSMRNQIINYSRSKSMSDKFRNELFCYMNDSDSAEEWSDVKRNVRSPNTGETKQSATNNFQGNIALKNDVQSPIIEETQEPNGNSNILSREEILENNGSSSEDDLNITILEKIKNDLEREANAENQSELIAENLIELLAEKNDSSREKTFVGAPNNSKIEKIHANLKKMRRSEIPLPKNRLEFPKKFKSILPLTQKTDASECTELYHKKKYFSPIYENVSTSRKDEKVTEEPIDYEREKITFDREIIEKEDSELEVKETKDIELEEEQVKADVDVERKEKDEDNSNVPLFSCQDKLENSGISKAKKLDLEMTKSSLILKTSSVTLHRLESLHQQNVSIKESSFIERNVGGTSSKLTLLAPKSSYNLLKGSKKNLSARSSSKANKPALKQKEKKLRKESESPLIPLENSKLNCNIPQKTCSKLESDVEDKTFAGSKLDVLTEKVKNSKTKERTNPARTLRKLGHEEKLSKEATFVATDRQEGLYNKTSPSRVILKSEKDSDLKSATMNVETRDIREEELKLGEETESEPLGLVQESTPEADLIKHYTPQKGLPLETKTLRYSYIKNAINLEKLKAICENAFAYSKCREDGVTSDGEVNKNAINLAKSFEAASANKLVDRFTNKSKIPKEMVKQQPKEKILMKSRNKKLENEKLTSKDEKVKKVNNKEDLVVRGKSIYPLKMEKPKSKTKTVMNPSESVACVKDIQPDMNFIEEDSDSVNSLSEDLKTAKGDTKQKEEEIEKRFTCAEASGEANPRTSTSQDHMSLNDTCIKETDRNTQNERGGLSTCENSANALRINKTRIGDPKTRSGLSKLHPQEAYRAHDKMDLFDEASLLKLRRRNSEPNSCRGFICRHPDLGSHRYNNTSVSSLASSLKHLHADELEDFIFWEAIPPMMTSCWEMSLYHFKKPWSMLSCSVFKDNRLSNTPGLILENLRSGGTLYQRKSLTWDRKGKTEHSRNDSFDVEPSIAQKDIDINNWLAALNFPTRSSTSTNFASEGNFPTQIPQMPSVALKKVAPKRRKGLPIPKFSIEMKKKQAEEQKKAKESEKVNSTELGLKNLMQKKSGGFVVSNQAVHSGPFTKSEKISEEFTPETKAVEKEGSPKIRKRNPSPNARLKKIKNQTLKWLSKRKKGIVKKSQSKVILPPESETEKSEVEETPAESNQQEEEKSLPSASQKKFSDTLLLFRSNINIWKFLFISTILIIMISHLVFARNFCVFTILRDYVP